MVLVSLNRYDREQFNKTEPLTSLDSVAQLVSAMATFSLCSNVDSILAREARTQCGRGRPGPAGPEREALCATQHWMHLHDKPCLLHTALSIRPIRCVMTQNDTFWKTFYVYSNITKSCTCRTSYTNIITVSTVMDTQLVVRTVNKPWWWIPQRKLQHRRRKILMVRGAKDINFCNHAYFEAGHTHFCMIETILWWCNQEFFNEKMNSKSSIVGLTASIIECLYCNNTRLEIKGGSAPFLENCPPPPGSYSYVRLPTIV